MCCRRSGVRGSVFKSLMTPIGDEAVTENARASELFAEYGPSGGSVAGPARAAGVDQPVGGTARSAPWTVVRSEVAGSSSEVTRAYAVYAAAMANSSP